MDSAIKFLIRLQANAGNVRQVITRTKTELNQLRGAANSVGSALSFSNLKTSLMSIPGAQFLTNPYVMAGAAVGAIAKVGMEAEKTATAFRVLVGDQEKSKQVLQDIEAISKQGVYGKANLEDAAKTMLSFGVSSDTVLERLKELGDIAGGDSAKLNSLSLVFGQVSAAGKLSGQDLLQFINAGFNPLKELETMTGKTYKDLQEMMSKGAISADDIAAAMRNATAEGGQFYGMADAQSNTLSGRLNKIKGDVLTGLAKVYEKLQPIFSDVVDAVQGLIPIVSSFFKSLLNGVLSVIEFYKKWSDYINIILVLFGTFIGALMIYKGAIMGVMLATKVWTAVQTALNFVMSANPIAIVVMGIAALVAAIVYCWNKFAGFRAFLMTMWDTMKQFGNIIKEYIVNRVTDFLSGIGDLGKAIGELFKGNFKSAWTTAKVAVSKITGVNAAKTAIAGVKATTSGISNNYAKHLAEEQAKQSAKEKGKETSEAGDISTPRLVGSYQLTGNGEGGEGGEGGKGSKGAKTASEVVTGGKRSSNITLNIAKFFDSINITMMDKADTTELEQIVLRCMNRALAVATSTDR